MNHRFRVQIYLRLLFMLTRKSCFSHKHDKLLTDIFCLFDFIVHILSFIIKSFSNELNKNFKMLCATLSICWMQFYSDLFMVLKICWLILNALFHTFKFCRKSWGKLGYAWIWDAKLYKWVNVFLFRTFVY